MNVTLCDVLRPSDWRTPALLCVRSWSVWSKRWSRRGRGNACWRSNCETPNGHGRTQKTATAFWRRRWRIFFPPWAIWPWVRGLVIFDTARPFICLWLKQRLTSGFTFRGRLFLRARVRLSVAGCSFKKKKKIRSICVYSGRT